MGALTNAAKFAKDTSVGGFRDQALAALVSQARATITTPPVPADAVQTNCANSVIRNAAAFADTAAWIAASDSGVYNQTAPATEASILNAIQNAWLVLSHMDIVA